MHSRSCSFSRSCSCAVGSEQPLTLDAVDQAAIAFIARVGAAAERLPFPSATLLAIDGLAPSMGSCAECLDGLGARQLAECGKAILARIVARLCQMVCAAPRTPADEHEREDENGRESLSVRWGHPR